MTGPDEKLVEKAAMALHDRLCEYAGTGWEGRSGRCPAYHHRDRQFMDTARAVLAALADDLAPAREPTVDRDALVRAIHDGLGTDYDIADAILASGVLQDAAAVRAAERRAVAEEFERHCREMAREFREHLNGPYADTSVTGPVNRESILGQSAGWENAANHAARAADQEKTDE